MHKVGFLSFLFTGMGFGGFFISWNITIYLLHSHRYPFLSYIKQPFTHFVLNNSIIPLFFLSLFFYQSFVFQRYYELVNMYNIIGNLISFVIGLFLISGTTVIYFFYTNKQIKISSPEFAELFQDVDQNVDDYYWRQVRSFFHYSMKFKKTKVNKSTTGVILDIFRRNELNSIVILLIGYLILLLLGLFMEYPLVQIPAAGSTYLLFSLVVSAIGILGYFFHNWVTFGFIMFLVFINYIVGIFDITPRHKAYGLDYNKKFEYTNNHIAQSHNYSLQVEDKNKILAILDNWKKNTGSIKPPLILINSSGGGLSSAYWTMLNLQTLDSATQYNMIKHCVMMNGSSGGMMALAYYRNLYYEYIQQNLDDICIQKYNEHISEDILNAVIFTGLVNDAFSMRKYTVISGVKYSKDRGFAWEQGYNRNTQQLLNRPLSYYKKPEQDGLIPMLVLTPTIINDARKLIISSQRLTCLAAPTTDSITQTLLEFDGVDIHALFNDNQADSLLLSSAVRMNATYSYVLPTVMLPTSPTVEVMDAGMRDNYGMSTQLNYIMLVKDWILENTSGVHIIHLRNLHKDFKIPDYSYSDIIDKIIRPIGHIYSNRDELADFNDDYIYAGVQMVLGSHIHLHSLEYIPTNENEKAGMSFHITNAEKRDIQQAMNWTSNRKVRDEIIKLFQK